MFVAVMSVMVVGVLSAVSLVLDEEEYMVNVQSFFQQANTIGMY